MARTHALRDDVEPRRLGALLLALGSVAAVCLKLYMGRRVKPREVIAALVGVWGYFKR